MGGYRSNGRFGVRKEQADKTLKANRTWCVSLLLLALLLPTSAGWGREYSKNVRATAQQILDGPFQFLLNARGFHARSLEHESDLFSAWGRILLVQNQSGKMSQAQIERLFVRAAKAKGWTITNDLPDIGDEARNGFGNLGESKEIKFEMVRRSHAQNPPTRYSCKVWVARDGTQVLAAFRVDAE